MLFFQHTGTKALSLAASATIGRRCAASNSNRCCAAIQQRQRMTRGYSMTANYSPMAMSPTTASPPSLPSVWFLSRLREAATTSLAKASGGEAAVAPASSSVLSWAIWLIKRTYQPSILKKKRQCGYMKRKQSVGGRRILKRRRQKGRKRLFGA
mmetsp:Transcript_4752/g.10629  ORF Transcript_4752/g.10629 Transcript_4752/m.10629 type:complete len:154 (-) Transcript_4752:206-667(-)